MTHGQLSLFPNASPDFLARNPQLSLPQERQRSEEGDAASVCAVMERCVAAPTVGKAGPKGGDTRRFLVRITSYRRRLIDQDNLCEKYVVDCCRYAGLLPGDGPGQTEIEVRQFKAGKEETERTLIEIFETP